ncbi:hypothetical protein [Devosia ginsengisoli]|uniref:TniQ family protein n=1 Tax=Devosia ginsengisoli TaxID=400770 RepID=A0A5B8LS75_9HYPH|nr:hypothetical protein [Devosia ginsengisoli]QDZ10731.1 hypothetical protein FPZ08_08175 [Devosia ginsengisoli]
MPISPVPRLPLTQGSPHPGESFLGFLTRSIATNPIRRTVTNIRRAQDVDNIHPRSLAIKPDDLERFAQLLDVDVAALRPTTLPPREGNSARLLGGAHIFPSDLDWRRRRLAPQRLRTEPYHRAIWQLRFLTVDPMTFEPLIDTCPVCRKVLRWARSVQPHLCDHCVDERGRSNLDLREFALEPISLSDSEAYRFVFNLVDPVERPAAGHAAWPGVKPGVLFELAILLARWANRSDGEVPVARARDIQPEMLAKAGRIILNGPAALRSVDDTTATTPRRSFRNSVITNRWLNLPVRQLVEQTIEPWTHTSPAHFVRTGPDLSAPTRALLQSPRSLAPFSPTEGFLNEFSETCANAKSDRDVARHMGIANADLDVLVDEGVLVRPSKLAIVALKRTKLVTGKSLANLLKHLAELEHDGQGQHVFPFQRIVETAQFPYSAGALITVVVKARLPIYRVKQAEASNWTSKFGVLDIDALPRLCQRLQLRPTRQGWLKSGVNVPSEDQLSLDL